MNEEAINRCPLCREPVQDGARKCPHCHHYLDRRTLALYHPLIATTPFLLLLAGSIYFLAKVISRGESFEKYSTQVHVVDSKIEFGQNSKEETVAVVGTIQNDSPVAWKDAEVQVQFLDNGKKLFDVKSHYGLPSSIPPHGNCAFKVSQTREFPKEEYQSFSVRVLWARDGRTWP